MMTLSCSEKWSLLFHYLTQSGVLAMTVPDMEKGPYNCIIVHREGVLITTL